jgi:prophage antirepressor-like protein
MELTELSIKGIHVLETSEGLLFKANDIATYLELSNINHNLSSSKLDKIKIKVNTLGGKQYVNFLTLDVVKQIICSSRKSKAIELGLGNHREFYVFDEIILGDLEILFEVKIKK